MDNQAIAATLLALATYASAKASTKAAVKPANRTKAVK
jgi:hypothetical protein